MVFSQQGIFSQQEVFFWQEFSEREPSEQTLYGSKPHFFARHVLGFISIYIMIRYTETFINSFSSLYMRSLHNMRMSYTSDFRPSASTQPPKPKTDPAPTRPYIHHPLLLSGFFVSFYTSRRSPDPRFQ